MAGFYDPDSSMLFAVGGTDRAQLRLILAHELVHALQHQYVPLDSVMNDLSNADRLAAAQSVFEGQATLVSLVSLVPDTAMLSNEGFWERTVTRCAWRSREEVFSSAPLVIREGLIFPYVSGADFVRWFRKNHGGAQPFGRAMPQSTEQILHPDRYARGDTALVVRFADDSAGVMHEDTFGELEIAILRSSLAGINEVPTDLPMGWGGDRMRVYRTADGPALVWYTAWDTDRDAAAFGTRIGTPLARRPRAGYRTEAIPVPVAGRAGVRVIVAPTGWTGWGSPPAPL